MSRISLAIQSDRKGFAIFLAMILTILIVLMGIYLIEKLAPAAKDVKGVEQGNVAYYKASSAVELALSSLSGSAPGTETGGTVGTLAGTGYTYSTVGSGTVVPKPGFGNSEYDHDWNVIAPGKPVQIKLPAGYDPGTLGFEFRVPDLNGDGVFWEANAQPSEALAGGTLPTINWIVTGSGDSLSASGSQITADEVNATASISISGKTGSTLSNVEVTPTNFATTNCASPVRCSLKISVVRPLQTVGWAAIPNLEYRITSASAIPQQWTRVSAQGYARGYQQSRTRNVEQTTVGEALDFTVFQ